MNSIIHDKYLRVICGLAVFILLFALALSVIKLKDISGPLIIHFDNYAGIDFFGGKLEVFGILFSGLAMVLLNAFLADFLYHRERFLSYSLCFGSLGLAILILIAIGVIISVN